MKSPTTKKHKQKKKKNTLRNFKIHPGYQKIHQNPSQTIPSGLQNQKNQNSPQTLKTSQKTYQKTTKTKNTKKC